MAQQIEKMLKLIYALIKNSMNKIYYIKKFNS